MTILSAILFGLCTAAAGLIDEVWHVRRDPSYSPELGLEGAAAGLALFAVLYAAMIYAYGAVSSALRKEATIAAYLWPMVTGLLFWSAILPLHRVLRDRVGFPDATWWLEATLLCGFSFEIIRLFDARVKKA